VVFDYVQGDLCLMGLASGSALRELTGFADPAAPGATPTAEDQPFDPVALRCDGLGGRGCARAQRRDRKGQLVLGLRGERKPGAVGEPL
jgi:hypothetical protein